MAISKLSNSTFELFLKMAEDLWPDYDPAELEKQFREQSKAEKFATYLYENETGEAVAFINLSLRSDYVEGSASSPVAYIEGIYVKPDYRHRGIATQLVEAAEQWGREHGCTELGSDTELRNTDSQNFHAKIGFTTADTIVHFIKRIGE